MGFWKGFDMDNVGMRLAKIAVEMVEEGIRLFDECYEREKPTTVKGCFKLAFDARDARKVYQEMTKQLELEEGIGGK